jgi:ribosomal protein L11 methyltransferase
VLDVGCGSGLLSIACARLGAEEVLGVDIDANAVTLASENAERNGAADRCRFGLTPPAQVPGQFDLVVANLPNSEIISDGWGGLLWVPEI